jgi:hypothetical protein
MDFKHRAIRETLRQMPLPAAREVLQANLPPGEYAAIYHCDVLRKDISLIADMELHCSESTVKRYRAAAYKKLMKIYPLR